MLIRLLKALIPQDGLQQLVLLFTLMSAAAVSWATWAEIPQLVRSNGQIIALSRTQIIQSANDGVVQNISVREGDAVEKGQLLMQLDASQLNAATEDSRAKVAALRATLARLQAEVFQRPLIFTGVDERTYGSFIKNQTELYQRRKQALDEELDTLKNMLANVQQELHLSLPLLAEGDISQTEVLRLRRSVSELQGSITNRRNKFFQDAQAEMTRAEEELATQEQMLIERLTHLGRMQIFAPNEGLVRNVRVTTLGGRVRPGDVVMDLLPTNSELIIETKLKPQDLAFIDVGHAVSIKLDAYDASIYGILDGTVMYISPDALTEDTRAGENIFYRVHVRIEKNHLKTQLGKQIDITPGMTTQIEIQTGKMTVLNYLLKPIVKTFTSALTER
ncbi:HlyD family efflux transporter periplasmic adaptor subunit [Limnohabitans sp. DCL3]|uniref:HlyD family efflux transporter periplasmic adaptor subunit n=1 Tax=Limnohabitans sp. DCL3 TaxID=3374103 RepID=UPI003A84AFFF